MSATARLALVPRDGLFCKDGRGWHTSASGRGHGLDWPWPSTVLGALRSAWGRNQEEKTGNRFGHQEWRRQTASLSVGRTLVLRRELGVPWASAHRVWPAPADALHLEGRAEAFRLDPGPPPLPTLGRDDDDAREALWVPMLTEAGKPLPSPRWWSEGRFVAWLSGRSVPAHDREATLDVARRVQVHVGIRPEELTADEGVLFSHDLVETLERGAEWAIGAEAVLPDGPAPSMATLGSDSRLALIEALPEEVFAAPTALFDAFRVGSAGLRLVVVSPACFEQGWLPDGLVRRGREIRGTLSSGAPEVVLRAALVPRPVHVSGWDMAANGGKGAPKPTSRLVPAGAVYFFERTDGRPFGEADAQALWLAALGSRTDEGYSRVVPAVWSPTRSTR